MFGKLFWLAASLDGLISGKPKYDISNIGLIEIKCHKSKNTKINVVVHDQPKSCKFCSKTSEPTDCNFIIKEAVTSIFL